MLALRKTHPVFGAELLDLPHSEAQVVAPGDVVVRVAAAGVCGSDLHVFEWSAGYEFMAGLLPVTLGHEFAGEVEAVGPGEQFFAVGDRVVCWPTMPCGTCAACRDGLAGRCTARRIVGLHRDGCFAARITVPARALRHVPEGLSLDHAALTEPLAVAVHAVDVGDVGEGDRVVVLGAGPIGLAAAWVAQSRGAVVLVAGLDDAPRLRVASELGIAHCADLATTTLEAAVEWAFAAPADRVIEAAGAAAAVEQGLAVLRPEGVLVVAGIHSRPVTIDLTRFVREKKQLRGAHDTTERAFAEALHHLACAGNVLEHLITCRLPLDRALDAMEMARTRRAVKVLLYPEDHA